MSTLSDNAEKAAATTTTATTTATTTTTTSTTTAVSGLNNNNNAYTNICPDGHACDNDSSCVESLLNENKYVCDCHDAYLQTGRVFAGLSCQHVATEFCTTTGELSHVSFCVNQGTCLQKVDPTAAHPGCQCPPLYTGEHCQYVAGSSPGEMSYFLDGTTFAAHMAAAKQTMTEGSGLNPAAIVVPILLVTFGALGYVLWKYRGLDIIQFASAHGFGGGGAEKQKHVIDKSKKADENMLEADGSSSMRAQIGGVNNRRRNSTPAFSSTHKAALMDPPDFEDLLEQSDHVQFHMDPTGTAVHKLFASDPTLHYNPTLETTGTGSGSPTGSAAAPIILEDYEEDLSNSPNDFEEYDPNDFSMRGNTRAGTARYDDPTFT